MKLINSKPMENIKKDDLISSISVNKIDIAKLKNYDNDKKIVDRTENTIKEGMFAIAICFALCCIISIICVLSPGISHAGSGYGYPEFSPKISYDVVEILKKNGMPVAHDRGNPWFAISSIPGDYVIKLYRADEVPQQAVLDIIKLVLDNYELRGKNERFSVLLYHESADEWRKSLFLGIGSLAGVKPYFKLTIGEKE